MTIKILVVTILFYVKKRIMSVFQTVAQERETTNALPEIKDENK